jgi:2-oxoglutarate ferredoxin oxidoreductase subunit beta
MATMKDFRNNVKPNWCPGCGDFSVQAAIQRAAANLGLEPSNLAVISGIGCSGRIAGYIHSYGVHGVHGRALPIAQGVKMANRELTVIAAGGDGDGFAIGTNHTVHAMRRNMDITYICMDNHIYGLTKGQTSPRSDEGFKTKSTPLGSIEHPISSLELAMAAGATFVAQSFSSDVKQLTALVEQAVKHKGFSFINVYSPCVTFNKVNTYDFFKENVVKLSEQYPDYNPQDRGQAMQMIMETEGMLTGVIYENLDRKPYEDLIPNFGKTALAHADMGLTQGQFAELLADFE